MNPTPNSLFKYLVVIEPLGFLYGSQGRFLSPENLVGRSGTSFPPSAATVSGIFAAAASGNLSPNFTEKDLQSLYLAGPFWGRTEEVVSSQNFYVPTPLIYLVKDGKIQHKLAWNLAQESWLNEENKEPSDKFESGTWLAIADWEKPTEITKPSWKHSPHLHPRLSPNERKVWSEKDKERGSLFLENAVQMEPGICLVYLATHSLESGWYRLGGEGHLVEITCYELNPVNEQRFQQPVGDCFALITPAVWGSNRLSYREPINRQTKDSQNKNTDPTDNKVTFSWSVEAMYTGRPSPFRYRLGNAENAKSNSDKAEVEKSKSNSPKCLSRGRYAVPAGSVYVVKDAIDKAWQDWDEKWFPQEGVSLKRWGCGLALPLKFTKK